jgi:hypothetical protein
MDTFKQKLFILLINGETLSLQVITPTTQDERNELRKLDQQGLTKFIVIDTTSSYLFNQRTVHKLINNFYFSKHSSVELIDRSKSSFCLLHIPASDMRFKLSDFFYKNNHGLIQNDHFNVKNHPACKTKAHPFAEMITDLKLKVMALFL